MNLQWKISLLVFWIQLTHYIAVCSRNTRRNLNAKLLMPSNVLEINFNIEESVLYSIYRFQIELKPIDSSDEVTTFLTQMLYTGYTNNVKVNIHGYDMTGETEIKVIFMDYSESPIGSSKITTINPLNDVIESASPLELGLHTQIFACTGWVEAKFNDTGGHPRKNALFEFRNHKTKETNKKMTIKTMQNLEEAVFKLANETEDFEYSVIFSFIKAENGYGDFTMWTSFALLKSSKTICEPGKVAPLNISVEQSYIADSHDVSWEHLEFENYNLTLTELKTGNVIPLTLKRKNYLGKFRVSFFGLSPETDYKIEVLGYFYHQTHGIINSSATADFNMEDTKSSYVRHHINFSAFPYGPYGYFNYSINSYNARVYDSKIVSVDSGEIVQREEFDNNENLFIGKNLHINSSYVWILSDDKHEEKNLNPQIYLVFGFKTTEKYSELPRLKDLKIKPLRSSRFSLQWQRPILEEDLWKSEPNSFEIFVTNKNTNQNTIFEVEGRENELRKLFLENCSNYSLTVRTHFIHNLTSDEDISYLTRMDEAPNRIQEVIITSGSENLTLEIVVTPKGCQPTGFFINLQGNSTWDKAKEKVSSINFSGFEVGAAKYIYVVPDLYPSTSYNVFVQPYNAAGKGKEKYFGSHLTLDGIPDTVSNLTLVFSNEKSIKVEWSPPRHSNGHILKYWVKWVKSDQSTIGIESVQPEINQFLIHPLPSSVTHVTVWAENRAHNGTSVIVEIT